ncbi:MAG: hypothetical protein JWM31_3432 [Solirubrobacterales bacterium]|nr:hypothetical protein [Solirubrobacterales bacterium]
MCECGRIGCTDTITLSHVTYEQVRTDFKRFLVVPGHQTDVDIVAETHPEHLVVIKSGVAKRVAEDLDPRANESADDQGRN